MFICAEATYLTNATYQSHSPVFKASGTLLIFIKAKYHLPQAHLTKHSPPFLPSESFKGDDPRSPPVPY